MAQGDTVHKPEGEKQIIESICGKNLSSNLSKVLGDALIPSINEVNQIYSQEIALRCLSI